MSAAWMAGKEYQVGDRVRYIVASYWPANRRGLRWISRTRVVEGVVTARLAGSEAP